MKVVFPTGQFISPGHRSFQVSREVETEVWYMGHFIETKVDTDIEIHALNVDEPVPGSRGEFEIFDRKFTVVRDDDTEFWGSFTSGEPRTKEDWLNKIKHEAKEGIMRGVNMGWWDLSPDGDPQKPARKISISAMQAENKTLMAHLMVDLGFFPSVGQARKNGWDKPLELGRHELGPRKKREFVEIIP